MRLACLVRTPKQQFWRYASTNYDSILIKNSLVAAAQPTKLSSILPAGETLQWYSCGPTVYEAAHIGHARSYVCTDIIRRILVNYFQVDVNFAMGITDVDDKILKKANDLGLSGWPQINSLVRELEDSFFDDMRTLNVQPPDAILRVSEHIPEIVAYVDTIVKQGKAYQSDNGVSFDVASFGPQYGKLGGIPTDTYQPDGDQPPPPTATDGSQTSPDAAAAASAAGSAGKKDWRDFSLWKLVKPGEAVHWPSPWGDGRPGWHIECSAMTHAYFGSTLHVHSGGIDLKFPHHTNEIAQCEAHNCSHSWVSLWLHTGHLYIDGRKMSKSLKNFITVKEFLALDMTSKPATDFRIMCLQQKYHASMHFSRERVAEASLWREKLSNFYHLYSTACRQSAAEGKPRQTSTSTSTLQGVGTYSSKKGTTESARLSEAIRTCKRSIATALQNDFDTLSALQAVLELASVAGQYSSLLLLSRGDGSERHPIEPLTAASRAICQFMQVVGLQTKDFHPSLLQDGTCSTEPEATLASGQAGDVPDVAIDALVQFRSTVRATSLKAMKGVTAIKKMQKKSGSMKVGSALGDGDTVAREEALKAELAVIGESVSSLMVACDVVRDVVAPSLGVRVDDIADVGAWKKISK